MTSSLEAENLGLLEHNNMELETSVSSIDCSDSKVETHLNDRAGLRADVAELIKPHRGRSAAPPFSNAALIVMAVVSSDEEEVSRLMILKWIIRSFKHYNDKAVDHYLEFFGRRYIDIYDTVSDFDEAFMAFDMPLLVVKEEEYDDDDQWDRDEVGEGTGRYSVDTKAARLYLRDLLEPPRKGNLRFLDLPAEVRNVIYEMTLQYPSSGLRVMSHAIPVTNTGDPRNYRFSGLRVMHRAHDPEASVTDWELVERPGGILLPPLHEILAILQVCKQVYQETAKTFYQVNTFCFKSLGAFAALSLRVEARCFHSFKGLLIESYSYRRTTSWTTTVGALARQRSCKFLSLRLHDYDFLEMPKSGRLLLGRTTKFTKISQIPGFDQLAIAASKADTFTLDGDCPLIQAFLDEEITKLKSGVGKLSKPRKRRRKK